MDDIDPWERPKTHVQWLLSNHCNYKCSYCYDIFHKSNSPIPDDNLIIEICKDIIYHYDEMNRDVIFEFMGGEPTLKSIIPDIGERLHNYPSSIVLKTNGSADLDWWKKSRKFLGEVIITVHREFADVEHIKNVVSLLLSDINFHPLNLKLLFAVTQRPESFTWGLENMAYFRKRFGIGELQLLYSDFGKTNMQLPYSKIQLEQYHKSGLPEVETIIDNDRNQKHKRCFAGIDILTIDAFGNVGRSWCYQDGFIGNIYELPIKWPTEPIICKKDDCKNWFDRNYARKEVSNYSPGVDHRGFYL